MVDHSRTYDAILFVSFGGPEGPDEVMPFLERVTAGRGVPRDRLLLVAGHYSKRGGVSPINQQNRDLIDALRRELDAKGPKLPIYFGNRNWRPFLEDTMRRMADDGVKRALAFVTSAYSSYSGCRQYREDIARARAAVGSAAPQVDKLRVFFNHPGFIEPMRDHVRAALQQFPAERRDAVQLAFTAHSIPLSMARTSRYVEQIEETCRLVAEPFPNPRVLVYQSRSGAPHVPWLEPDICDHLRQFAAEGSGVANGSDAERVTSGGGRDVVIVPIGFTSDHMEVAQDLDTQARDVADSLGVNMVRAATAGTHARFVSMIRELIVERMTPGAQRAALGALGPSHDVCPDDCCPAPVHAGRPAMAWRPHHKD